MTQDNGTTEPADTGMQKPVPQETSASAISAALGSAFGVSGGAGSSILDLR